MDNKLFEEIERKEDEILNTIDKLSDDIRNNIRITSGMSEEFKSSLNDKLIDLLYIIKSSITWERE